MFLFSHLKINENKVLRQWRTNKNQKTKSQKEIGMATYDENWNIINIFQ